MSEPTGDVYNEIMRTIILKKDRIYVLISFAAFLFCSYILFNIFTLWQASTCSNSFSIKFLQELCSLYKKEVVSGSLCHSICVSHTIRYQKCTNYRDGKVVIVADADDLPYPIILKSAKHSFKDFDSISFKVGDQQKYPYFSAFRQIIRDSVLLNLGLNLTFEIDEIGQVWSIDTQTFFESMKWSKRAYVTLMDSVWPLIQQDEYLLLRLNQHLPYMPKLYGTCGYVYAVEYAPPSKLFYSSVIEGGWSARAKLALGILDVVRALDFDFHEPLHICDVKPENFGISSTNKRIKLIDTDCLLRDSIIKKELRNKSCHTDQECTFFDCKGWCRTKEKKCANERINTNLQVVCEYILQGKYFFVGLLKKAPLKLREKLSWLLRQCAYPVTYNNHSFVKYYKRKYFWELYRILQRSIGIGVHNPGEI